MKVINPSYEIENINCDLKMIERAGRVCYKSEDKITEDSAIKFCSMIKDRHHDSVLEHGSITVRFICDRGFSHEMVRHRLASFSQESTRYCNYSQDKFGSEITFIRPAGFENWTPRHQVNWTYTMQECERNYLDSVESNLPAQDARSMLPNSLKTEIVVTANPREWRHILKLRTSVAAHPSMKQLMFPLLNELKTKVPVIFDDITP